MNTCRLIDYDDCCLWRNVQPRSEWKSHARGGGIRSVLWVCSDVRGQCSCALHVQKFSYIKTKVEVGQGHAAAVLTKACVTQPNVAFGSQQQGFAADSPVWPSQGFSSYFMQIHCSWACNLGLSDTCNLCHVCDIGLFCVYYVGCTSCLWGRLWL